MVDDASDGREIGAKPDADALEARVELAALREAMFGREAAVRVGRHRLIRLLGRGAHGSVFEAEDTELSRRLAVKLVQRDLADKATRDELLAEARAMAQLNHPNVVTVYEAGISEDRLWIAMELVRGSTLQAWSEDNPVDSSERFERARLLLEQAGRGLAAAHASGLVHRDFKPGNVLLGDDGRAQVADFGLARAWQAAERRREGHRTQQSIDGEHSSTAVAGTPRYMSPEQIRGLRVDHRSDQFNFAVTAWELVYGVAPHGGDDLDGLLLAIESGPPTLPRSKVVPRWYGRALRRALMPDPRRRYSSMDALVSALDPVVRQRRAAFATGTLVVGSASVAAIAWPQREAASIAACDVETARAELAPVWNDSRRARLSDALLDPDTLRPLLDGLNRHAEAWTAQYEATCAARWRAESIGDRELDARMACLRRTLDTMDATVHRLESATPDVVVRALGMVKDLPEPSACEDPDAVSGGDPETLRRLGKALAAADADRLVGRYAEAGEAGVAVASDARDAGAELLAADALEVAGRAWRERDDARGFDLLAQAHGLALAAGDDRRATRLAIALALQHAYVWHVDDGRTWLRHAEAGLTRRPDPKLDRARRHAHGLWLLKQRRPDDALAIWEPLAEELAEVRSSDDETAWLLRANLVLTYTATRRLEDALALAESMLQETREDLGGSHPYVAVVSSELARIEALRGDDDAAMEHAERSVAICVEAFGPASPRTSTAHVHLGLLQHRRGLLDDAEASYRAAIASSGDRRDQWLARAHRGLGRLHTQRGDLRLAADALREAVSAARDAWDPERGELLETRRLQAEAWIDLDRLDDAKPELERILEVAERISNHEQTVRTHLALAKLHDKDNRPDAAETQRESAQAICRANELNLDACR